MTCRRAGVLAGLALVLLAPGQPARAQEPTMEDLRKEIEALRQSVEGMQKDLQEIKALLQRPAAPQGPQNVTLDLGTNPSKGNPAAALTIVEFTDYQCPFCGRYFRDTYPQIDAEYVATGKVRYVLMDLPLESIHKLALKAAEAANCAGDQGKYWEMHDRLFANQQTLDAWTSHAGAVGLDVAAFEACLASGRHAAEIRRDAAQAQAAGVSGTPGFFLAGTEPGSTKVRTRRFIRGAQPYPAFKAQIDALLAELEAEAGK